MNPSVAVRHLAAAAVLIGVSSSVLALQDSTVREGGVVSEDRAVRGYLAPGEFDVGVAIPPAPVRHDPRDDADRRIFRSTRALLGTPRGALATADADDAPAAVMRDFSCALGVDLTPTNAPRLLHLALRAAADTSAQNTIVKNRFRRQRPFHRDKGPICESREALGNSFDYPSGHAVRGWTWGLVLTEVAPDRAQPILARARAFGESRFVCGAHNASSVEASALAAGATMALVRTKADYRRDLAAAQAEIAALRANAAADRPALCGAQEALTARSVLAPQR